MYKSYLKKILAEEGVSSEDMKGVLVKDLNIIFEV